jgi:hypothetical protein
MRIAYNPRLALQAELVCLCCCADQLVDVANEYKGQGLATVAISANSVKTHPQVLVHGLHVLKPSQGPCAPNATESWDVGRTGQNGRLCQGEVPAIPVPV